MSPPRLQQQKDDSRISRDEMREMLASIVDEQLAKHRQELWVEPDRHFLDHEWTGRWRNDDVEMRANHEWVCGVRAAGRKSGWQALTILIAAVVGWILWTLAPGLFKIGGK